MDYYFKCPYCKSRESFSSPTEDNSDTGCMLFLLGGLLPLLLFSEANINKIQCNKCGYIFRKPKLPSNSTANLVKCFLLLSVVLTVSGAIVYSNPQLLDFVDNYSWLMVIEDFIRDNSRLTAVLGTAFLVFATFISTVAILLANRKSNIKLRSQFKTELEPFSSDYTESEETNEDVHD